MTSWSRRRLLAGAAGASTVLAGCLSEVGPDGDDDDDGDSPGAGGSVDDDADGSNGHPDDDGAEESDEATEPASMEAQGDLDDVTYLQYSHPRYPDRPVVELFTSSRDVESWLDGHDGLPADDRAREFLEGVDFSTTSAVAIEAGASDLCHELAVRAVEVDDGTLSIRAAVRRQDDAGDMCAQQMVAEGAVIRATASEEPPTDLSVSLDADGGEYGIATGSDTVSETDDEDGSDSEDDRDEGE